MAEGLKIIIGADIKEAQAALKKVTSDAQVAGKQVDKSFSKANLPLTKGLKEASTSVKKLSPQISTLGNNIETLRAKALARKNFLLTETDITKIKIYNQEIKALEAEIARIQAIGTGGITQSLGGVGTGTSKAFGALRTAAQILPGIGIAGLIGGLSDLVIGLFKASDAFSKTEIAAAQFSLQIAESKKGIDEFISSLDFTNEIEKLKAKLQFGEGFTAEAMGFKIDKAATDEIIKLANEEITRLSDRIGYLRANASLFLSKQGQELLDSFFSDADIPDDLIKKLSEADQKIINEIKGNGELIEKQREVRLKAFKEGERIEINSQIKANEEKLRLQKEAAANFDKFVNETISKAKELSSFIDKRGVVDIGAGFEVDPRKTKLQNFQAAKDFIQKSANAQFPFLRLEPSLIIKIKDFSAGAAFVNFSKEVINISSQLQKRVDDLTKNNPILLQATINREKGEELFKQETENAERLASTVNGLLTPAFDNLFEAIKSGENPLKAFFEGLGQAVLQLIQKLIQAAITAAILSAILPGGGGGFGALFGKFLGLAGGGLVSGPTLAAVGEGSGTSLSNPEVVAPLDQLKAMLGDIGTGGAQVVVLRTQVSGNNLSLVQARTSRRNKRLGATG